MKIASQSLVGLRVYTGDTRVTCIRCSKDSEYYDRDDPCEIHSYEIGDFDEPICCDRCGVELLDTLEEDVDI